MDMSKDGSTRLVPDPGRPSKPVLAARFARSEFRINLQRIARGLGIQKLHDAMPSDWAVPDSTFAKQSIAAVADLYPDFMMRHCFRSYCFGAILAARNKLKLDKETFFVAAMLHDLGVCDAHADDPGTFEWVGARLAHKMTLDEGEAESRAITIHNSIALHTSMGLAGEYQPEIALLHFGTGMDLFGMRLDEIPKQALDAILTDYPRDRFKAEFAPCLAQQAEKKPDSQIAGAVGIGILDRILAQL